MSEPFDVCWDRIRRADAHRKAIAKDWNTFINEEAYATFVDVDRDGTGTIWIEQVQPLPEGIALVLGEFLYQLRAALDACIYETACLNGKVRPPAHEDKLEFPICMTPTKFQESAWKIVPLTKKQRRFVESIQPYATPKGLTNAELPYSFSRALGILNDWARKDRHRKLHVVATRGSRIRPMLRVPQSVRVSNLRVDSDTFILKSKHKVATFSLVGYRAGMNVQANPNLMLDIAIDEIPPPCHHIDTLAFRMEVMEFAVVTVVGNMSKTVGISPPKQFVVGRRRLTFNP